MRSLHRLAPALLVLAPALLPAQAPTPLDRRVDSVFAAFDHANTPGCSIGVDRAGTALIRRAYGMANLETGTPFTVSTISESGSTAKQFVATALVMLARDGKLSLDDDVSRWVPEVKGFGKRITIRHVLSHTSGLPDRYTLHEVQGRPAEETDHPNSEVLAIVAGMKELNFDPGEDYLYSNTGYVVAVAVIERVSGKTLQQFTEERIFAPLGMTSTRWREDHRSVVPRRASAYQGSATMGFRNEHPFTRVFGSGGLLLDLDDYLKWSAAFQRGEGQWGAIRDSLSAVIKLNDGTAITYGLGVSTDTWRGVKRISHTGSTGGYRAALYRYPDQQVSVALLCNGANANPGGLATSVAAIVLGDALEPVRPLAIPAIANAAEALVALTGRYHSPRTEEVMVLVVRDGNLVDSTDNSVYLPWGDDRYRLRNGTGGLQAIRDGAKLTMRWTTPGARPVDYERVRPPDSSPAAIAALAGTYRATELGADLTIASKGGKLVIERGWRGDATLTPLYRDGFALPDGKLLRFTRDSHGKLIGFVLWDGRVRHLRFDRVPATR